MKVIKKYIFLLMAGMLGFVACKKKEIPVYDSVIKDSVVISLKNTEIDNHLDSLEFLETIGNQKLQQVYDISTLQMRLNQKDSTFGDQIQSFFWDQDSMSIKELFLELDSLNVRFAKVYKLNLVPKDSLENDSIGKMKYSVYYFNKDQKYIGNRDKKISYILKKTPEKLVKQFSFYFYDLSSKDTIESGVKQ